MGDENLKREPYNSLAYCPETVPRLYWGEWANKQNTTVLVAKDQRV